MGNTADRDVESIRLAERQAKALDLRKRRFTYDAIAKECGYYDRSAASKDVKAAIAAIVGELPAEVRALELEDLDFMRRRLEAPLLRGDIKAIAANIRLMERRAKLLGLDAPTKVEGNITGLGEFLGQVLNDNDGPEGASEEAPRKVD
jgi:hypothetical protein